MKNKNKQIGKPMKKGFGQAAIDDKYLPKGFKKLEGHNNINSKNYGNVLDKHGSIMVWIPKFYFKWTKNNKCKISAKPKKGYLLHRAFIDGGLEAKGIFVDKYECGNIDGIFISKKDLPPCSTGGDNNISSLRNNPNSNFGGLYKAVKTRGKKYNLTTIFTYNALSMLMYANNGNKLEQMKYHNNQDCGVRWIDPNRYEIASRFIKLNDTDTIFKVLKPTVKAKDIQDDADAYNEKFYDDVDLTGVVDKNDFWVYLEDKSTTFKMGTNANSTDHIKTCMGIPNKDAISDNSNDRYAKAGIYRCIRNELACLCGGIWGYSSDAGAFAMHLLHYRTHSNSAVGGRASVLVL